jgi:hypothetical protein
MVAAEALVVVTLPWSAQQGLQHLLLLHHLYILIPHW